MILLATKLILAPFHLVNRRAFNHQITETNKRGQLAATVLVVSLAASLATSLLTPNFVDVALFFISRTTCTDRSDTYSNTLSLIYS